MPTQNNLFAILTIAMKEMVAYQQLQYIHGPDREKAIAADAADLIQTVAMLHPDDPSFQKIMKYLGEASAAYEAYSSHDLSAIWPLLAAALPNEARKVELLKDVAAAWQKYKDAEPKPVPALAFPSNLPVHITFKPGDPNTESFTGDKYAIRWALDPRQADEAKAIYDARDVVYHSPADLAGSWYVGPHSLGPAIGDPWQQETYFNGDPIS